MNSSKIKKYIEDNFVNNESLYNNLMNLYNLFAIDYIKTMNDFINSHKVFYDYLIDAYDEICNAYPNMDGQSVIKTILEATNSIKRKVIPQNNQSQIEFANIVTEIAKDHGSKFVLDVGPGFIPYSSIVMGKELPSVGAMDESFQLPDNVLHNLNVKPYRAYLRANSNIDDFDMVVGRFPCEAIDTIVYLCSKYKKPYFIETCDCDMPSMDEFYRLYNIDKVAPKRILTNLSMSGQFNSITEPITLSKDGWFSWRTLLPELDKNIEFEGSYAFNVGESAENIKKLIKGNRLNISEDSSVPMIPTSSLGVSVFNSDLNFDNCGWFKDSDEKEFD